MSSYPVIIVYVYVMISLTHLSTQDAVIVAEEKAIINALKEPNFNIKRDFKTLLNTTTLSTVE